MATTHRRVQVPLDTRAQEIIHTLREPRIAPEIRDLLGGELPSSDAGILSALVRLGAERVHELQEQLGYLALARSLNDPDEIAYRETAEALRRQSAAYWAEA